VILLLYRNEEFEINEVVLQICLKTTVTDIIIVCFINFLSYLVSKIIHITDKRERTLSNS
jgi:hypothetical protein